MFRVDKRHNDWGRWFPIWETNDGTDAANYLRNCVETDDLLSKGSEAEYRIVYKQARKFSIKASLRRQIEADLATALKTKREAQ